VLATSVGMNPQIRFGEDLMSRVSYSMMHPEGARQMTAAVRKALNELVTQVSQEAGVAREEILEIRHSSLYAPRDFDISPYFEVVKPTIVRGFDYKAMAWADLPATDPDLLVSLVPADDDLTPVA